jgi:hypothetical protein
MAITDAGGDTQATPLTPASPALPPPLVRPLRHPIKWLGLTTVSVVAALVFAHIGSLDVAGLYYAVFEWNSHMTAWWHSFISDRGLRHAIRDVAEGFYGGAIAQQLVWNAFRKHRVSYVAKPMNRLDKLEVRIGIPNLRSGKDLRFWQIPYALLIWAPLYGSVGFAVTYLLDAAIRHDVSSLQNTVGNLGPHASIWRRVAAIDTSNWDKKIMGLAASVFFGRRPLRKVFDGVQLWFAKRHVAGRLRTHWFYPPTYRARCNYVAEQAQAGRMVVSDRFQHLQVALMVAALVPVVVLAGLGFYVLTFVAQ